MKLLYVLTIIALCSAQDGTDQSKLDNGNEAKTDKLQENVEALMRQVGELGMLLENYRRVILGGMAEANDICGFIERLSAVKDADVKSSADRSSDGGMGVRMYKNFFQNLNDPVLKAQLFSLFETHIDNCFADSPNQLIAKRDKSQLQKVRFHSWGGKRNRGAPKVVIRTPFHSWGGKRSGQFA